MEFDAWIEGLGTGEVLVGGLAGICTFAYLLILARSYERARLLLDLARHCRRRLGEQEELLRTRGFAPALERYRRLARALEDRLAREGVRGRLTP